MLLSSFIGILGLFLYGQVSTILNTAVANYYLAFLMGIVLSVIKLGNKDIKTNTKII